MVAVIVLLLSLFNCLLYYAQQQLLL